MKQLISRRSFLKAAGVTAAAASMAIGAPAASACWVGDKSDVTILYTNDVHTYIDKQSPKLTYAAIADLKQSYQNAGKDVLLAAKPEDVRIIHSPVGMPGRALNTPLVQALAEGKRFPPKHCARCLKTCDPAAVPYCITHALIEAVKGNVEEGLFFCGENVGRLDRMRTVRELMDELVTEWRQNL